MSERRTKTISEYLIKKPGIKASVISAKGMGEKYPRATNSTDEGRQMNRRIEIILQRK